MENMIYAHRSKLNAREEDLIINYILGKIDKLPKDLYKEVEPFFFAACLLVPRITLIKVVEGFGGIESFINNEDKIKMITRMYNVPYKIAEMRLIQIYNEEKEENQTHKLTK